MSILCPKCGGEPRRTHTSFGLRLDCCGLWAWGEHPLVDADFMAARRAAIAATEILLRSWLDVDAAREALAKELGLPAEGFNMKALSKKMVSKVPAAVRAILARGES